MNQDPLDMTTEEKIAIPLRAYLDFMKSRRSCPQWSQTPSDGRVIDSV